MVCWLNSHTILADIHIQCKRNRKYGLLRQFNPKKCDDRWTITVSPTTNIISLVSKHINNTETLMFYSTDLILNKPDDKSHQKTPRNFFVISGWSMN